MNIILLTAVCAITVVSDTPLPSAKELLSLMCASRDRYWAMDAVFEIKSYKYADANDLRGNLVVEHDVVYRKKYNTEYKEATRKYSSARDNAQQQDLVIYSKQKNESKQLRREPVSATPRVEIYKNYIWQDLLTTPCEAIWNFGSYTLPEVETSIDKGQVEFHHASGCYILDTPIVIVPGDEVRLKIYIDPKMNYVPCKVESFWSDSSVFFIYECFDFKQIEDIWIPMRYTRHHPKHHLFGETIVKNVTINKDIDNAALVLDLPDKSIVKDYVRNIKYVAGKKVSGENTMISQEQLDSPLPPPATDAELAEANLKAQELLAQQKQVASGSTQIVPIEITPAYVWVLPGKNEYVLSVNAGGKTPSLAKHTIDPNGLVMHGFEDKIAAEGKIKVSLERPAGHKAFADGILTLDFADQKKTVHFVAAPVLP